MRVFRLLKESFIVLLSALCVAGAAALARSPAFEGGEEYALYLGASSSAQRVETSSPALDKLRLAGVRGESVRYEGDRTERLIETYRATLLFTEEVCGVKNYYLYSPILGEGALLNGVLVNLHIAAGEGRTTAGTPLIFGGA